MDPGAKRAGDGSGGSPDLTAVEGMPLGGAGIALPPRFERQLRGAGRGRRGGESAWVAVARVEGVATIRAAYGDPAAEEFLRGTASVLRSSLRESDKLAPVAREQYGIILDAPRDEDVVAGLERLVEKVRELSGRDRRWKAGALSVGVAPVSNAEPAVILERARAALERAVGRGHGAVVISADPS
jgi:GGDEF domain-containing protein